MAKILGKATNSNCQLELLKSDGVLDDSSHVGTWVVSTRDKPDGVIRVEVARDRNVDADRTSSRVVATTCEHELIGLIQRSTRERVQWVDGVSLGHKDNSPIENSDVRAADSEACSNVLDLAHALSR